MESATNCQAVVEKIIQSGEHGPYVVARSSELDGSVTFSLDSKTWQEKDWPEPGTVVLLSDVRKKRAGWRAHRARFVRPSDMQQPSNRKEHKA